MKCPVCRIPTYVVEFDQIEIDMCAGCEGLWFDRGELDLLLDDDAGQALTAAAASEAVRSCPLCAKPMAKVNIGPGGGVLIDSCGEGCGLWFDRGELGQLAAAAADEGWSVSPRVREFLSRILPQKGEER
jgi:Zn-finger nucleic acid-binding protein